MRHRKRLRCSTFVIFALFALVVASMQVVSASAAPTYSTPVGALPKGPVSTVTTRPGLLVAVALPRQKEASGLVWRLARNVDAKVVRQLSEADVGSNVVVVFKVVGSGKTSIVFALTRGERSKAFRAHTTRVDAS